MTIIKLILLLAPFQSSDSLKQYLRDGDSFLEKGQYEQALTQYKEAFRLEPKAARVKIEGTFFEDYLPRYKIALCYEQIDILQAEDWAAKSKEALEEEVIRRKRKELATYHEALDRIGKSAARHREALAAKYQVALNKADALLSEYRFDEAKAAFEALIAMDPDRPGGIVGMEKVNSEKANYIRGLELDTRSLLLEKRFDSAEETVKRIAAIDPENPKIATLRAGIREARNSATAAAAPKRDTGSAAVQQAGTTPVKEPVSQPSSEKSAVVAKNASPSKTGPDKKAVRLELLATLEPYRRGDPEAALDKLKAIDAAGAGDFASYHWLRGVYLLSVHQYQREPDQNLKAMAGDAMDRVLKLQPDFTPDADLYPDFVVAFYAERGAR